MEVVTSHETSHSPSSKPSAYAETQRVAALEDSLRDLTDAHRIARLGTWSWERATGAVVNSPELYAIYGIDPGEVVDLFENGEKLYAPESWQRLQAAATETFATGLPFELDMEIVHPQAESVWVIVSGEVADRDAAGEISMLRGTVQEITTRKHVDQELARSEATARRVQETLEGVLAGMTDGLSIVDKDWIYTYFNEQGARLLGVRVEDMLGHCIWDLFPLASDSAFGRIYRESVATGKPAYFIDFYPEPINKWIEVHCYPSADGLSIYFRDVTADRLAQQAIIRSESDALKANEKLEAVLDSMTDGLAMLDKNWRYTYFSERGASMLGLSGKDRIGLHIWEIFPHYKETNWGKMYLQAVATGTPVHFEEYFPAPRDKWLECRAYPSDEGLAVYFTDITERKKAAEAIARSEAAAHKANVKLEGVLSGMTDGLITLDKDWRFTYYSERGAQLLGVIVKDMIGNCVWDVFPHAEESLFGRMYHQAVDTRQPVHFEEYYPEPLNIWLECHCYPTDEGLSVYFRDISERKHAAEAIARSQAEAAGIHKTLEAVLAGMTDGLNIVDRNWRYTYVNEQSGVLLSVAPEAMLGNILWDMFPAAAESSFGLKMREAVANRAPTKTLDYYPEPVNKWLECHFYPSAEGLSIYFTDVTAKLLAEESLQRTEKLATAGLLAASIAAEIKAPLDSAASLLHFSLQMELSDQVRANLLLAEHKLARVAQATTQTLRFHRHSTTIPARADVSELMDSALALFDPRFLAAGIHVQRDYVSHPRLFCYGDEVRQVFANLLSNALEATPREGTICLRVRPAPFFGGVRVTIADDGHGIPAALQARIFDLFVTSKDDTTAGLGLWVSEGIMRKHKGRIAVRSSTGSAMQNSGTVFSIFLPYSGVEPPTALTARKQAGNPTVA